MSAFFVHPKISCRLNGRLKFRDMEPNLSSLLIPAGIAAGLTYIADAYIFNKPKLGHQMLIDMAEAGAVCVGAIKLAPMIQGATKKSSA